MSTDAEWQQLRILVKQRLHTKYDTMSDFMRNLPTVPYIDSKNQTVLVSPNDAIREVEHFSDIGQRIIYSIMKAGT